MLGLSNLSEVDLNCQNWTYLSLRYDNCPKCNQLQPFLKSIFTFIVSQQHVPQVQKDMSITMEQNIFITRNVNPFWSRETYFWDMTIVQNVINYKWQPYLKSIFTLVVSQQHISQVHKTCQLLLNKIFFNWYMCHWDVTIVQNVINYNCF